MGNQSYCLVVCQRRSFFRASSTSLCVSASFIDWRSSAILLNARASEGKAGLVWALPSVAEPLPLGNFALCFASLSKL
ncbi:MAG: hypothetical protein IJS19_05995 [Muribaculaceae bacterium]|nr:hypothetical protein [Muribaculaceae bacterium]